jgi:methylmalonyl-CoA/ethylmalonyl-CoA epimerase
VRLDHVALLTTQLEPVLERVTTLGLEPGPIESFPAEGTRECYVGAGARPGQLLLMEAIGDGPYARALAKRGPGLHHVAYGVPDLDAWLAEGTRGWLLHPHSLTSLAGARTVWLARPGVPTLIEACERDPGPGGDPVVAAVELPTPSPELLCWEGLRPSPDSTVWLQVGGQRVTVASLCTRT